MVLFFICPLSFFSSFLFYGAFSSLIYHYTFLKYILILFTFICWIFVRNHYLQLNVYCVPTLRCVCVCARRLRMLCKYILISLNCRNNRLLNGIVCIVKRTEERQKKDETPRRWWCGLRKETKSIDEFVIERERRKSKKTKSGEQNTNIVIFCGWNCLPFAQNATKREKKRYINNRKIAESSSTERIFGVPSFS